jgi:CRP-like cAMP-binding protein
MKKHKGDYDASQSFIYRQCLKEWWPALDAHREILQYKKSEIIFSEGDEVKGMYFLLDGVVKVHKHWTEEKELIVRFARRNEILGHRGLSTQNKYYPITATALSDTTLCFFSLDFFHSTLKVNTGFLYECMMLFADELQLSEQRMRDLAHMPVKGRVAKALLTLAGKFGTDEEGFISFAVSRQDIAAYTGTTYETVYKLMMEFSELGLIKTEGKQIGLVDRDGIAKLF